MAEDIRIGLDASEALSGINKLEAAFESLAKQAGLPDKVVNSSMKGMTRSIESVNAAVAKQTVLQQQAAKATLTNVSATQKLAAEEKRVFDAMGLVRNKNNSISNKSTGQFASKDQIEIARSYVRSLGEINAAEELLASTQRTRADRAARYNATQTGRTLSAAVPTGASMVDPSSNKQGAAAVSRNIQSIQQQVAGYVRLRDVMDGIPPVRMAQNVARAQQAIMGMSNSTRYAMYDVSSSFGIAGAVIAGWGILSVTAAVAHERAFANVERTTQTTAAGYAVLQRQLEEMSMTLPVSFEGLTEIASAAGQLGIQASGVSAFTSVVARLSATTNLTADAAGVALARFKAFFSESETSGLEVTEATFSNLASSILKVGVNSIATESGIVNVAIQIASMADYAGYTANQVIGLAGALSSIGVAPELSRGTITRTFSNIGNAVSAGGVQLEKFAALAGVSSAEFKRAWGTEAFSDTFTKLVAGIKGVADSGGDANLTLQELGFNSVRDRPLLLRLAEAADEAGNSGGLLAQTMRDAYAGWVQNSELALQYSKISTTTSARIQVLGQAFQQLAASMGEQSSGFLGEMAVQLTNVVKGFEAFSNTDAGQALGSIAVQGALVVGALMLVIAAAARGAASLQGIGTAMEAIRKKTGDAETAVGRFGTAMKVANLALGLVGVVATLAAVVGGAIAMNDAASKASRGVKDLNGLLGAMRTDAENGATALGFTTEVSGNFAGESAANAEQTARMTEALYGIRGGALNGAEGMDALAESASSVKYAVGEATNAFFDSELLKSDGFQGLFKGDMGWDTMFDLDYLRSLDIDATGINFDSVRSEALKQGGDVKKEVIRQLREINAENDLIGGGGMADAAIEGYAQRVTDVYGNLGGELRSAAEANAALQGSAQQTFETYAEGGLTAAQAMSQLDEVTQKAVDAMAAGFAKFGDTGNLIKLTQAFSEIGKASGSEEQQKAADAYEKAWADAYGGASFKLGDYLEVQRRANQEQETFVTNLGSLSASANVLGLSDAFIAELAAMGPEAAQLVQALVDGTDDQLVEFVENFGRTGYDATVAMAVQMELGNQIIANIMATGGADGLADFNAALASGVGVDAALASLQRDVDGKPIDPKAKEPTIPFLSAWQKQNWTNGNALRLTGYVDLVAPVLDTKGNKLGNRTITAYADGGLVNGPGSGTSDSINAALSNGEFVMTAKATRAIGVNNLYSMMKAAQGGRAAPRGRGYAQGGVVSGGSSAPTMVYLSPEDRQLLRNIQPIVRIGDRDIARANSKANFVTNRQGS